MSAECWPLRCHCARVRSAIWTGNPFSSPSHHSTKIFRSRLASSADSPAHNESKSVSSIRHSPKFSCGCGFGFRLLFYDGADFSFGINSVGSSKSAMAVILPEHLLHRPLDFTGQQPFHVAGFACATIRQSSNRVWRWPRPFPSPAMWSA